MDRFLYFFFLTFHFSKVDYKNAKDDIKRGEIEMPSHFGNSVQEYYLDLIRHISSAREKRLQGLQTASDAEAYRREVREKIFRAFDLPKEKSPLNVQCSGVLRRKGFSIEKLIYWSRPGFPVTANLYLPEKRTAPIPAVLYLMGHNQPGKAAERAQVCARTLAAGGVAVLIPDPVSQGERYQFLGVPGNERISGSCTLEHNMLGKQLLLAGDFFGTWRVWDAFRGLDCLCSRPGIDPERIGVAGCSGGGTLTAFLNALDDRLSMASPCCCMTTWRRNVENELPVDIEQLPPFLMAEGLEMADLLIAAAPRPLLISGEKNDFFDPRGTVEVYEEVRRFYTLLGRQDAVKCFIGEESHGFREGARRSFYQFVRREFCLSDSFEKEDSVTEAEKDLFCTESGNVASLPGNRFLRDLIRDRADSLGRLRRKHSADKLRTWLRNRLAIGKIEQPFCRILRPRRVSENAVFSRFGLETEKGCVMSVLKLYSDSECFHLPESRRVSVYIPHLDSESELAETEISGERVLYGLDVRGIGELRPSGCDQFSAEAFFHPYGFDYHYASLGLLTGHSYLGGKVRDLLCTLELLAGRGASEIEVKASGQGCVPALLAAFLSDRVTSLVLIDAPRSWDSMLREEIIRWPQSCMVFGILRETDLPEIAALMERPHPQFLKGTRKLVF